MSKREFENIKARLAITADAMKCIAEREAADPQMDVNDLLDIQEKVSGVVTALDKLIWRNG